MLQLTDRSKIYFYIFLLFVLLSLHNHKFIKKIDNFFTIKQIILSSNIDENFNNEIYKSLSKFRNLNILSIDPGEIKKTIEKFNIINDYNIKKQYPSILKVSLAKTNILAFYYDGTKKIYIGENGKKIKNISLDKNDLPIIFGEFPINEFLKLKDILLDNGFEFNDFNKLYFFKSKRWDLIYDNKIIIKLPINQKDFSMKILKKIFENLNLDDIKTIDLRISDRIIVL